MSTEAFEDSSTAIYQMVGSHRHEPQNLRSWPALPPVELIRMH